VEFAREIAALLGVGVEFGLVRPYGRAQELEADRLGLFTMAKAGSVVAPEGAPVREAGSSGDGTSADAPHTGLRCCQAALRIRRCIHTTFAGAG
jgi:hypothetical protein